MLLTLSVFFVLGNNTAVAQDELDNLETETTVEEVATEEIATEEVTTEEVATEEVANSDTKSFHQIIKQKFIEGGPGFMGIVLLCLILGLALAIERIIYLNLATTNTNNLLNRPTPRFFQFSSIVLEYKITCV